jgi:protein-S-isoprenylcysteine O-methyltransferase Ste14
VTVGLALASEHHEDLVALWVDLVEAAMNHDQTFRIVLVIGALIVVPIGVYHRLRSQTTGEKLDRWQEGPFILFTLRPIGIFHMLGLITYIVNPKWMAWSSMNLPIWLRWVGVGIGVAAGTLLIGTFRSLGKNLTDTVVTRKEHMLVTSGPYRWVRHPFYVAFVLAVVANSLVAANWFLLLTGLIAFALIVVRTRKEEERLLARFGDAYREYMKKTGRFLPRAASR